MTRTIELIEAELLATKLQEKQLERELERERTKASRGKTVIEAIALPGWTWLDGMKKAKRGGRVVDGEIVSGDEYPDLRDGATCHLMLAMLGRHAHKVWRQRGGVVSARHGDVEATVDYRNLGMAVCAVAIYEQSWPGVIDDSV